MSGESDIEALYRRGIAEASDQAGLEAAYIAGHTWAKAGGGSEALTRLKAAYAHRSTQLKVAPPLADALKDVVRRGTQMLRDRLDDDDAPDQLVLRAVEVGARALGMGARPEASPVQVNLEVHLEELGQNLVRLLRKKQAAITIEGEATDERTK